MSVMAITARLCSWSNSQPHSRGNLAVRTTGCESCVQAQRNLVRDSRREQSAARQTMRTVQGCIQRQHQVSSSIGEAALGLPHHVQQHAWRADRAAAGICWCPFWWCCACCCRPAIHCRLCFLLCFLRSENTSAHTFTGTCVICLMYT